MSNYYSLTREIAAVLNRHSLENASNTPDFILAQYLLGCLAAFDVATQQRETWAAAVFEPPQQDTPAPPQPSTADLLTAPSPEDVGQGEVAEGADLHERIAELEEDHLVLTGQCITLQTRAEKAEAECERLRMYAER